MLLCETEAAASDLFGTKSSAHLAEQEKARMEKEKVEVNKDESGKISSSIVDNGALESKISVENDVDVKLSTKIELEAKDKVRSEVISEKDINSLNSSVENKYDICEVWKAILILDQICFDVDLLILYLLLDGAGKKGSCLHPRSW